MRPIYENIPALSILFFMLTGIVSVLFRKRKTPYYLTVFALVALLAASLSLTVSLSDGGVFTYSMGKWGAPWGNELRASVLEALLASAFAFTMLMSVWGGRHDAEADIREEKQGLYYILLDLLMASMLAMIYTNDIFTGYVFIEINTMTACGLVMAKEEGRTIAATVRYLIMSLVGSALFLMSVVLLYGITGHLLMDSLAPAIAALTAKGSYVLPLAALSCLMVCGLAIKSALYPFSTWLPDAHGTATTTSSAVLSGLVIKGYIILLMKVLVHCYGPELTNALGVSDFLLVLGALAMVMGSLKAIRETHLKRMIAYSTVAQVGYIFLAIGMGTVGGYAAAFFQILAHAVAKALIFTSAGGMIDASHHRKQLSELTGAARRCPLGGLGFTVGGLAMVGLPLLGSFVAKLLMAQSGAPLGVRGVVVLAALAVSGVLNALYYLPAMIRLWSPDDEREEMPKEKMGVGFTVSVVALMAAVVALGTCYQPVAELLRLGAERM